MVFSRALTAFALMGAFLILLQPAPSYAGDGPPISGTVQNFIVFDKPIPAPQIPLSARTGGEQTLADWRGKIVVVNFWATWCGPCIREMPTLARLQEKFAGDDFEMVIVSQDRGGWKVIERFMNRLKLDFPNSLLDGRLKLSRAMQVQSLPVVAILDRQGNEVGRVTGGAEWDAPEAIELIEYYLNSGDSHGRS